MDREQRTRLSGPEEVEAWVGKWGDRITRFAYTYLRDWMAAEDVAQETFIRLYHHGRAGRPVTPGWLFTVARNLATDRLRRPVALPLRDDDAALEIKAEPERGVLLRDAVDRLRPRDREVLWLFYYGDYSMAEIAEGLHIPLAQVKSRLHRARGRLKAIWEDADEQDS